jgi:hypothetical protein
MPGDNQPLIQLAKVGTELTNYHSSSEMVVLSHPKYSPVFDGVFRIIVEVVKSARPQHPIARPLLQSGDQIILGAPLSSADSQ